ncbi:hypothetical protein HC341_06070 [Aquisalimonas sp. 2447]|uniref:hypothetical protein n=1 Tax=Aquisalimonas sp. 2447 TaxID=2740807 RepID=UPI0014326EBC|nr:hypothetical protein [Aquisalimonas sp. 2447]QIT54822.1 hypothetical protein HC341_06070 [Aquisalimonas sp. 2447]
MHDVATDRARPYGIVVHDGQPWAVLFGTNRLATVEEGELMEIELPREDTRPRRLAISSDGLVWYGDYATGYSAATIRTLVRRRGVHDTGGSPPSSDERTVLTGSLVISPG